MAVLYRDPTCAGCSQYVLRDCPATLDVSRQHPCPIATLRRFAQATADVGIDLPDLIQILRAGVPINSVLDLIESRLKHDVCGYEG